MPSLESHDPLYPQAAMPIRALDLDTLRAGHPYLTDGQVDLDVLRQIYNTDIGKGSPALRYAQGRLATGVHEPGRLHEATDALHAAIAEGGANASRAHLTMALLPFHQRDSDGRAQSDLTTDVGVYKRLAHLLETGAITDGDRAQAGVAALCLRVSMASSYGTDLRPSLSLPREEASPLKNNEDEVFNHDLRTTETVLQVKSSSARGGGGAGRQKTKYDKRVLGITLSGLGGEQIIEEIIKEGRTGVADYHLLTAAGLALLQRIQTHQQEHPVPSKEEILALGRKI